jgi:hypothetical protein
MGNILKDLLPKKLIHDFNTLELVGLIKMPVIKKPERTKNISTP